MASGCLLFLGIQKRASIEQLLEKVPPLLVLTLIIGVMYLPMRLATISTITVVILSAVLIASLKKRTRAFAFFTHPKVIYIGLISYSLYLWHWGVLSISRWTIGIHWWSIPFQVSLLFGLAIASYRFIETPLRKGNWFGKRWKTIVFGGGVIVTLSGFLIAIGKPLKGKLYSGKSSIKQIYKSNLRDEMKLDKFSVAGLTGKDCHIYTPYSSEQLRLLFNECKYPLIRQSSNQSTIAFLGDSHARYLHLKKSSEILTNSGFRVIHYSHGGCPFPVPPYGINPPACNKFLLKAENKIFQDLKQGDSIVIYNYHLSHLGGSSLKDTRHNIFNRFNYLVADSSTKIDLYMSGLNRLSKKAEKKAISIYLIGSAYRNKDLMFAEKEWFRPYPIAARTLLEETNNAKKLNKELSKQIEKRSMKNVTFIDPIEILDESCGRNITSYLECFIDSDHLSDKSSKELIDFFMKNYLKPLPPKNFMSTN